MSFSNYITRTITTTYDIAFLRPNFFVANSGEKDSRLRIWKIEGKFIQGQKIATLIHTTSLTPEAAVVLTSNGILAI